MHHFDPTFDIRFLVVGRILVDGGETASCHPRSRGRNHKKILNFSENCKGWGEFLFF